jgi:ribonuclease HII
MARGLIPFDKKKLGTASGLTGIDEAGRGCLAGPVVAAAVYCRRDFYTSRWCRRHARGVDDSKRLSANQRADVVNRFKEACHENWIRIGIGEASVEEIERHNIYKVTVLAMRRAHEQVFSGGMDVLWQDSSESERGPILIDGKPIRSFPLPHEGIVKGDQRSLAMALAGIHAKESRDSLMRGLDRQYPKYGFSTHKGYGTRGHLEAIREFGITPVHRPSFLVKFKKRLEEASGVVQDSLFQGKSSGIQEL